MCGAQLPSPRPLRRRPIDRTPRTDPGAGSAWWRSRGAGCGVLRPSGDRAWRRPGMRRDRRSVGPTSGDGSAGGGPRVGVDHGDLRVLGIRPLTPRTASRTLARRAGRPRLEREGTALIAEIEVGAVINGTVARITPTGPSSSSKTDAWGSSISREVDRNYVKDVHEHLREGDIVEAKVVAIKEDGKIDLSIKALQDPAPPRARRRVATRVRADAEEVHAPVARSGTSTTGARSSTSASSP